MMIVKSMSESDDRDRFGVC